mmetsp:Transcript_21320/g.54259  ORF Transcript_21320/g.54259 Transcript_21320/m.54259 type:complete len:205 (+) Transcript_21320:480-1094(+)
MCSAPAVSPRPPRLAPLLLPPAMALSVTAAGVRPIAPVPSLLRRGTRVGVSTWSLSSLPTGPPAPHVCACPATCACCCWCASCSTSDCTAILGDLAWPSLASCCCSSPGAPGAVLPPLLPAAAATGAAALPAVWPAGVTWPLVPLFPAWHPSPSSLPLSSYGSRPACRSSCCAADSPPDRPCENEGARFWPDSSTPSSSSSLSR